MTTLLPRTSLLPSCWCAPAMWRFAAGWVTPVSNADAGVTFAPFNGGLPVADAEFPHPTEWQSVGFAAAGFDIARIDIAMAGNDGVTLDDVQFSAAVPEPGCWLLLLGGGLLVATVQRRRPPDGPGRKLLR